MEKKGEGAECCMCGDEGLSSELFKCKSCGFRSQHKYCSRLYPGAESYNNCNWCLPPKDDKKGENTTKSSHKTAIHHHGMKIKKSKRADSSNLGDTRVIMDNQIKRPPAGRKRVMSDGGGILKRSRSEEVSKGGNGMIIKPVSRNRVRRYKLLEEVSS